METLKIETPVASTKKDKSTWNWKPLALDLGKVVLMGFIGGAASFLGAQTAQAATGAKGAAGKIYPIKA